MSKKLELDKAAESIATMVTEWVDGGIKMGTDWRSGLASIIQLRLDRVDAISQLAALREELANVKRSRSDELENYNTLISEHAETVQRLADAERRSAKLEKNAARYIWLRDKSESIHQFYLSTPIWFTGVKFNPQNVDNTIDAALAQPTESGASDA